MAVNSSLHVCHSDICRLNVTCLSHTCQSYVTCVLCRSNVTCLSHMSVKYHMSVTYMSVKCHMSITSLSYFWFSIYMYQYAPFLSIPSIRLSYVCLSISRTDVVHLCWSLYLQYTSLSVAFCLFIRSSVYFTCHLMLIFSHVCPCHILSVRLSLHLCVHLFHMSVSVTCLSSANPCLTVNILKRITKNESTIVQRLQYKYMYCIGAKARVHCAKTVSSVIISSSMPTQRN